MMIRMRIVLFFLFPLVLSLLTPLAADEGMWPLYDLKKLPFEELKARGLELDPGDLYDPEAPSLDEAVIRLGGGTASFVSPNALIVTNHHVAFTAIQRQATVDRNYVEQGFYAATHADEIPAEGYTALVTLTVEDITDQVLATVRDDMDPLARYMAIDKATKEIVKKAEEGRDVKCEVAPMFGGKQFILYTYFEIRDIRIVYAPPEAIGNYGDDIDNWRWPRHGGDFSFMRAYVAPDGKSAEYAKENVPYHPRVYLPLSAKGMKEGDISLVLGFPGSTQRYASSYHIDDLQHYYYPQLMEMLGWYRDLMEDYSSRDSSIALRLEDEEAGIDNFLLYANGLMEGFERSHILETKREEERRLAEFLAQDPALADRYGTVLPELESLFREKQKTIRKDFVLGVMTQQSALFGSAVSIHKWAVEREKPDMEREQGYQDRDTTDTIDYLTTMQINLVPEVDKELVKYFLGRAFDLPEGQKIEAVEEIFAGKKGEERAAYLDEYVDELYSRTQLGDQTQRLAMFRMTKAELEKLEDPFITLAASLEKELEERRTRTKERTGALNRLSPLLIQAFAEMRGGNLYPDATFSMRLNIGEVKGYSPRDAIQYSYITGLTGLMEKETGEYPFIVPRELKEAYQKRDYGNYADPVIQDVPVDLLTTNDGTGGNSGSPVLNGKGEIIGLDFDTNYESVAKDYLYSPELARAIICDIRYVLFVIDRVYKLEPLLAELTIHQ